MKKSDYIEKWSDNDLLNLALEYAQWHMEVDICPLETMDDVLDDYLGLSENDRFRLEELVKKHNMIGWHKQAAKA